MGVFIPRLSDVGPKPWHLSADLLENEDFLTAVWDRLQLFNDKDPIVSWEKIKEGISRLLSVSDQNGTVCFKKLVEIYK